MLVILALVASACGSGAPASAPGSAAPGVAVAATSASVSAASGNPAAPAPKASAVPVKNAPSGVDCAAADEAYQHFAFNTQLIIQLRDDRTYEALLDPTSMFYLDTTALRADLTVLSTLPDIAEVEAQYHGKPSQMVPQFRRLLAQADANVKAGSKPFSDGSGNGQKEVDLAQATMGDGRLMAFPATVSLVCQ